ncbi:MAG: hypothetical protein AB1894_11600 [Chloroflexota bacterium]
MKKKYRNWLIALAALVIAGITVDQLTVTRPAYPVRDGDPVPARPRPEDEPFVRTPLAPTYEQRKAAYLQWLLARPTPDERGGVWADIAKLAADPGAKINEKALQAALDFVNSRQDPSDFNMASLVRLYYLYRGTGALTAAQEQALEECMLNSKYWLDEPGTTYVEMWTENHQMLSASAEYLAGQAFPGRVFSNDGLTGRQKMQKAQSRFLRWADLRARTGFAEWDSTTYYPEDLAPLLNLVQFAEDDAIAARAAMLVDLILFDTAVDSYYGFFATSHGRVTSGGIKSQAGDSMATVQAIAFGLGRFQSMTSMAASALATSPKYAVPPVLQALALDNPPEYTNFERHSIPITDESAARYGISATGIADAPVWWGFGAFTLPGRIDQTIQAADTWDLWHYPDFADLKDIARALQAVHGLSLASRLLDPDSNGVVMDEVNKVTYRTPDYMLSSAQDYRKGQKGYQQHIWQATLDSYAVVFATNPDDLKESDRHRPSYWMSNGRLPRTAQYKNLLVALYDIPRRPSAPYPLETRHYAFTHAYFPKWAFDEVREVPAGEHGGGWILGRRGDGYVALYSDLPYQWTDSGPDAGQEVIALGYRNVWLCQLGRAAVDGSFEAFAQAIAGASLSVQGLRVAYDAPDLGLATFDWQAPFVVGGEQIPLRGYPRWDNPYTQAAFDSLKYRIEFEGKLLELDLGEGTRIIE